MPLIIVGFGVALLLMLIVLKVKPLYALLVVSVVVGLAEGLTIIQTATSIWTGIWSTLESLILILCLGAMFGKVIEVSGAAGQITKSLIQWFGVRYIQWAVMLTGLIVGIPLFYNAGFVILIPLIFAIARNANVSLLLVGIPMAASLSVTHGFLPPHPGPTAIAAIFHADVGRTMLYGLLISIPAVIIAGPVFSQTLKKIVVEAPSNLVNKPEQNTPRSVVISFAMALLPVLLIALGTALSAFASNRDFQFISSLLVSPSLAIGLSLILSLVLLGVINSKSANEIMLLLYTSVKDIAIVIMVIAAGGGFKQILIDSGVGEYIKSLTTNFQFSPLILGWLIAALLRVSLGSATVAALTSAGIVLPLLSEQVSSELMVLAVGSGSLMFSHVNDTGFWMFKEYFNLSLGQTFRSWSLMETIVSITGLLGVLLLDQFI